MASNDPIIFNREDFAWLIAHGGEGAIQERSDLPEGMKMVAFPPDILGTAEHRQRWFDWFEEAIVRGFRKRRPQVQYAAFFINQAMDSSEFGRCSWMAIGPGCSYTTVSELVGQRVGDVPSRFQYFEFAVDLSTWPKEES